MSRTGQLYSTAFGNFCILVEFVIFKEAQMLYVALGAPLIRIRLMSMLMLLILHPWEERLVMVLQSRLLNLSDLWKS